MNPAIPETHPELSQRNRLRICVIGSTYPRYNEDPAVPWLRESVRRLVSRGHQVTVLAPSYEGLKDHKIDGVQVFRFRYAPKLWEKLTHEQGAPNRIRKKVYQLLGFPYLVSGIISAAVLAKRRNFDIINVHWPFPHGPMAWIARKFCNAAVVATCHGAELALARRKKWIRRILGWSLLDANSLTCNSSHTANEIRQLCGRDVHIIPYGITVQAKEAKSTFSEPATILFSGRLIQRKGVDYLIRAMPLILKSKPAK
ncbi:MAG: glycosyltransferase family 4 protein, partial [Desulfobacterales bacterium]|nr:glycosyltransferase family 4 protein [Desulfobacterales bacterium]